MNEREQSGEAKWELGRGIVTFVGHPPVCQGLVEVVNRSPETVRLRRISVEGFDFRSVPGPRTATIFARLEPYERMRIPVQLRLHEAVPPGTYTGQMICGSQREPAVVHVLEHESLDVAPSSISVTGGSKQRVNLRVFVTNRGNVNYRLADTDSLYLEDKKEIRRSLTAAVTEAGHQGYQKFLDHFVNELTATSAVPAAVKIKSENPEIRPGEVREVTLDLRLPDNLKKNRVYAGNLIFRNTQLHIEIESHDAPEGRHENEKKR